MQGLLASFSEGLDGLLMSTDPDQLVSAWISHAVRGIDDEEFRWSWEHLDDLVRDDPELAWRLILRLVPQSSSDKVLAVIAAGPLEDLLCKHGPAFIDRATGIAHTDSLFRRCLRGVWGWSRMPAQIRARIDDAVKVVPIW
jgi:hypothetical protein